MQKEIIIIGSLRVIILLLKVLTEVKSITENEGCLVSRVHFGLVVHFLEAESEELEEFRLVACEIG